jgi:hypothetical protein
VLRGRGSGVGRRPEVLKTGGELGGGPTGCGSLAGGGEGEAGVRCGARDWTLAGGGVGWGGEVGWVALTGAGWSE